MLLHVGLGSEESFLFAAPKRHADRAARLHAELQQDAGRLHHDRAPDGVVGGAGRGLP